MDDKQARERIVDLTSKMLDNPNEYGIYPTTEFYDSLLALMHEYGAAERAIEVSLIPRVSNNAVLQSYKADRLAALRQQTGGEDATQSLNNGETHE